MGCLPFFILTGGTLLDMKDNKQVFAIVGLLALIVAAVVVAMLATKGAAPVTNTEQLIKETNKETPKGLGAAAPEQATGDSLMLGGGKKGGGTK